MKIKAITIDFWNTLYNSGNGIKRNEYRHEQLKNAIQSTGCNPSQIEFEDAMRASWEYFNKIWLNDSRTPAPEDTVGFFLNYMKVPYDYTILSEVARHFGEAILVHPPDLMESVPKVIEAITGKFELAIVSDTGFSKGTELRQLLEQSGIAKYFSAMSFSDETGVSKPHPKAFLTALNELSISPEEAIHIGDIEATDIIGAKNLGMKAIKFTGDPTARHGVDNNGDSLADYVADSWSDILEYIDKLRITN
ncbi:MAG: putative hydrolase of the superfamily [Ignavibacteria bacterium]|nr:putative hydrolase of the superfamily [Ignavibacteria bacterium]